MAGATVARGMRQALANSPPKTDPRSSASPKPSASRQPLRPPVAPGNRRSRPRTPPAPRPQRLLRSLLICGRISSGRPWQ
eukprot:ctg_2162.g324